MWAIFKKDFGTFWYSLLGYIVVLIFLIGTGVFIWLIPETSVLEQGFANLDPLFNMGPYLLLFLVPAVTMKSFAEEFKTGTVEFLFTKPISYLDIILGKYLACVALIFISVLPTLIYFASVYALGNPVGNIDSAGFSGSFVGLLLLGAVFGSIGIFSSSLTDNQILSFVLALVFSFLFYQGFDLLAGIPEKGQLSVWLSQLGVQAHYESFSKGLLDSRDLFYFFAVITLFLLGTKLRLESRTW